MVALLGRAHGTPRPRLLPAALLPPPLPAAIAPEAACSPAAQLRDSSRPPPALAGRAQQPPWRPSAFKRSWQVRQQGPRAGSWALTRSAGGDRSPQGPCGAAPGCGASGHRPAGARRRAARAPSGRPCHHCSRASFPRAGSLRRTSRRRRSSSPNRLRRPSPCRPPSLPPAWLPPAHASRAGLRTPLLRCRPPERPAHQLLGGAGGR